MKYKYEIIYPKAEVTKVTPVVMTLHGMGASYLDLRPLVSVFGKNVIELHLQGDLNYRGGYAYFTPEFGKKAEIDVIGNVVKNIHDQVQEILKQKKLQNNPLFSLGFSQGAIINTGLSIFYPNWLDVVVILSARLPAFYIEEADKNLVGRKISTKIFISQGQKDTLFKPKIGREIATFFRQYASSVESHEYPSGHTVNCNTPQDINDWVNEVYFAK